MVCGKKKNFEECTNLWNVQQWRTLPFCSCFYLGFSKHAFVYRRSPQPSQDVSADADFTCDKPVTLGAAINETLRTSWYLFKNLSPITNYSPISACGLLLWAHCLSVEGAGTPTGTSSFFFRVSMETGLLRALQDSRVPASGMGMIYRAIVMSPWGGWAPFL